MWDKSSKKESNSQKTNKHQKDRDLNFLHLQPQKIYHIQSYEQDKIKKPTSNGNLHVHLSMKNSRIYPLKTSII